MWNVIKRNQNAILTFLAASSDIEGIYELFSMKLMKFYSDYRYGGGPAVNHLYICHTCQIEAEKIEKRRKTELEMFVRVKK